MKGELDKQLCEDYPKIFANRNKPMTETAMCWGFDCGDGWFDILDNACRLIQNHIDWNNRKTQSIPQVVADQVKEKFGTLRFYTSGGDDYTRGVISMAEAMSSSVCEICGNPGSLRGKGWLYTACDEHTKAEHLDNDNE